LFPGASWENRDTLNEMANKRASKYNTAMSFSTKTLEHATHLKESVAEFPPQRRQLDDARYGPQGSVRLPPGNLQFSLYVSG